MDSDEERPESPLTAGFGTFLFSVEARGFRWDLLKSTISG